MKSRIETLVTLVGPDETINSTVSRMASDKVAFFGLAVIVDEVGTVLGIINNGDIIRLLASGYDFSNPVSSVMITDPISVLPELTPDEIIIEVHKQVRAKSRLATEHVVCVLVIDRDGYLISVLDNSLLNGASAQHGERVAVYGLGYVGLTLSVSLANNNHIVSGIDIYDELINKLKVGQVHIHEPGLEDMLASCLESQTIDFFPSPEGEHNSVSVIAVGTPVDDYGNANLDALEAVTRSIGSRLKRGDLVLLRSTVPVGSTRNFVKPLLEELSGMIAGEDFYLSFTPERTIEGRAMSELRSLPQIVGGLTPACSQRASNFWRTLTSSVVHVDDLEAAELVKLANNSFRDHVFAFSNALSLLSAQYNVDAFRLISAANEGYPRNRIPLPSPGVGGYCLTKDPFLYASAGPELDHAKLARSGRAANQSAALHPVKIFELWASRHNLSIDKCQVLIIGLAFKGLPETNDLRGSAALDVARALMEKGVDVFGWDAVASLDDIQNCGLKHIDIAASELDVDAVIIMNNHPDNVPVGLVNKVHRPALIFDGWAMLDSRQVEQHAGLTYSTMGYISPEG